jgi:hypothetical protein
MSLATPLLRIQVEAFHVLTITLWPASMHHLLYTTSPIPVYSTRYLLWDVYYSDSFVMATMCLHTSRLFRYA